MKNACICLKTKNEYLGDSGFSAVIDAFLSGGYTFDEVLCLNLENEKGVFDGLNGYKQACDNVVVVVGKAWLSSVRLLIQSLFPQDVYAGVTDGAGIFVDGDKTLFLLVSDLPSQGQERVQKVCLPYLQKKFGGRIEKLTLRAIGADERLVFDLIERAKRMSGGSLAYTHKRKYDEDVIEIFYDASVPKMLTDDVVRLFAENLVDNVYAYDDVSIEEQVIRLLKLRGKKISVAESFTGGGIARKLTSVSGASEVYFEGINAYHEGSKMNRLGVDGRTLMEQGAVSQEVAYQMATGLLATGNCDVCIATTGLAGPNSDKSGLPVGLCFLAVGNRERILVSRYKLDGNRDEITQKAINYALFSVYKLLKDI